jgi:Cohesin domain
MLINGLMPVMKRILFRVKWVQFIALLLLFGSKDCFAQAPVFTIASAANVASTSIVIPVTTQNFTQFLAWQGSVNWDNSKLNFAGVSAPIAQLTGMQFNASVAGSTGRLSFLWVDNNLTPQSIANNAVLFSITFNVVSGASGSTSIIFSNNPTSLLLSDAATLPASATYSKGLITFPTQVIPPEFMIGPAFNVVSSTLVIPVRCKNFLQLLAWQGSINWDNTKLTYVSVSGLATPLSGMLFNASVSSNTGRISFAWTESTLTPQSIADSSILFNITFNVVNGATGSTDIVFSSTPTPLLVSDANSTAMNNVVYTKGTVYFPGAVIPPEFIIGSSFNVSTSALVIPVTAKNFIQLLGWQGSITWDNTRLGFVSVSTPIAQLSGMLFNATVSGNTGRLAFLWTDNNLVPQTISDNTVLFTLNFNVAGPLTGITYIDFSGTPTSLVVSNALGAAISSVIYTSGVITFSGKMCPGGSTTITSNITGASYQWQLNTGAGYNNLVNNSNYTGCTSQTLNLNNIPSNSYGYLYRCFVNGLYSNVYELKVTNYWVGGFGTAWENPANWSCGVVPDQFTDVFIDNGVVVINSNVNIRTLSLKPGVLVTVAPGFTLIVNH